MAFTMGLRDAIAFQANKNKKTINTIMKSKHVFYPEQLGGLIEIGLDEDDFCRAKILVIDDTIVMFNVYMIADSDLFNVDEFNKRANENLGKLLSELEEKGCISDIRIQN